MREPNEILASNQGHTAGNETVELTTHIYPPLQQQQQQRQEQQQQQQQQLHQNFAPLRAWKTGLCDCSKDEEICWWSLWCCWIVDARTAQSFGQGNSLQLSTMFWVMIFVIVLMFILLGSLYGFIVCAICFSLLLIRRVSTRVQIRQQLGIFGSTLDDCLSHACCPCCATCQEAREAKAINGLSHLDYCSGEVLSDAAHEALVSGNAQGTSISDISLVDAGLLTDHFKMISRTSKIILSLSAIVFCGCLGLLVALHKSQNIAILVLIFVQPMVILYFVYWRSRRQYASLDYVIKLFAVGFWFTTFQSVVLELILQTLISLALTPFMGNSVLLSDDDGSDNAIPTSAPTMMPSTIHSLSSTSSITSNNVRISAIALFGEFYRLCTSVDSTPSDSSSSFISFSETSLSQSQSTFYLAPSDQSLSPLASADTTPHFFNLASSNSTSSNNSSSDAWIDKKREAMRSHIFLVIFGLFLTSFVVAAGVEETMKHFVVRCCQFPSPLKDPNAILVYLVAGAVGFATSENIEYCMGQSKSPVPGTSVFVGEIITLLIRVLMPIHFICSVLQASQLGMSLQSQQSMSLFRILLPAICLHGTFDFVLFLMAAMEFVYDTPSFVLEILSLVVSGIITIAGSVWSYYSFKRVHESFLQGWVSLNSRVDSTHGFVV